jgi:hypothetical protein
MVPPVLLFDGRIMGSINIIIFTLEVEFTLGSVEALFVVLSVIMESNSAVEFRGNICGIVLIFVGISYIALVTTISCAITSIRIIVSWIRVTVNFMESKSDLSLMSTFKGVGNITILSIVKVLNMEDVFLTEMIKFSWWSWQLGSEVLFGPLNAILSISVLRWIKLVFYWFFSFQICLESLFFGNERHFKSIIKTRRSKDGIRLGCALNHGLFTLHLRDSFLS